MASVSGTTTHCVSALPHSLSESFWAVTAIRRKCQPSPAHLVSLPGAALIASMPNKSLNMPVFSFVLLFLSSQPATPSFYFVHFPLYLYFSSSGKIWCLLPIKLFHISPGKFSWFLTLTVNAQWLAAPSEIVLQPRISLSPAQEGFSNISAFKQRWSFGDKCNKEGNIIYYFICVCVCLMPFFNDKIENIPKNRFRKTF